MKYWFTPLREHCSHNTVLLLCVFILYIYLLMSQSKSRLKLVLVDRVVAFSVTGSESSQTSSRCGRTRDSEHESASEISAGTA